MKGPPDDKWVYTGKALDELLSLGPTVQLDCRAAVTMIHWMAWTDYFSNMNRTPVFEDHFIYDSVRLGGTRPSEHEMAMWIGKDLNAKHRVISLDKVHVNDPTLIPGDIVMFFTPFAKEPSMRIQNTVYLGNNQYYYPSNRDNKIMTTEQVLAALWSHVDKDLQRLAGVLGGASVTAAMYPLMNNARSGPSVPKDPRTNTRGYSVRSNPYLGQTDPMSWIPTGQYLQYYIQGYYSGTTVPHGPR